MSFDEPEIHARSLPAGKPAGNVRGPDSGGSGRPGWLVCLVLLLASLWTETLAAESAGEYQVKAAFIYNFTKFVEWPPTRTTDPQRPIAIGILGSNPFDGQLESIIRGRTVNGRALIVRSVRSAEEVATVDLLFVCAGEEQQLAAMRDSLQRAGVLTVGESDRFIPAGGMINFIIAGDKLRFAVNLAACERAGLKLSAQLLKLAIRVDRKNPGTP